MAEEIRKAPLWEYSVRIENVVLDFLVGRETLQITVPADPITHVHAFPELFVCGRGKLFLKTLSGVITLNAGDAAVVPPGVSHVACGAGVQTLFAGFTFRVTRRKYAGSEDLFNTVAPLISGTSVLVRKNDPAFWETVDAVMKNSGSQPGIVTALGFAGLLIRILSPSPGKESHEKLRPGEMMSNSDLKMMNSLECLIEERFTEHINAADLALSLHISTRQLSRTVKKLFGTTLHELILIKRVSEAERLISSEKITVESAANAVGFGSAAGLYRGFKKLRGTTPAQIRKNAECLK